MSLQLDPTDRQGAALNLQLIGKAPASDALPSAFVETLFDHYAESFDESLVDRLGYRLPGLLDRAIRTARPGRFPLALDLGCGTGLMGQRLRPIADRLEGYDISTGMLKQARAKGIYDFLGKADLRDFSYAGPKAELVTVADVFIYVGALDGMAIEHLSFRQALGARGHHILLADLFQERVLGQKCRRGEGRQHQRRQWQGHA